ncbi:hypothetical protein [Algoriphagus sp. AK58]|uniref:hypothetical protein n=1 Tax=Algoriphagus sp. AK58 TaxID=1406877 RepID=UPI00165071AE|nr:hypothetical protein [Algoriphagus sp. AK58]
MVKTGRCVLLLMSVIGFACTPKTDQQLKPLFEALIPAYLLEGGNTVWVIAESDSASNRTMFGMDICSAEFLQRGLVGKNRMIFDGREAKMTIWDCISTCLNESKAFRFTEEHFPEGVELISQSHLDSLQALVDSKVVVDSLKSEAMNKLHFQTRFRFSKPLFFGGGNFALLYYTFFSDNSGYVVMEKKSGKWEEVFREIYTHY